MPMRRLGALLHDVFTVHALATSDCSSAAGHRRFERRVAGIKGQHQLLAKNRTLALLAKAIGLAAEREQRVAPTRLFESASAVRPISQAELADVGKHVWVGRAGGACRQRALVERRYSDALPAAMMYPAVAASLGFAGPRWACDVRYDMLVRFDGAANGEEQDDDGVPVRPGSSAKGEARFLANFVEALVEAVYSDGGADAARQFVLWASEHESGRARTLPWRRQASRPVQSTCEGTPATDCLRIFLPCNMRHVT